MKIEYVKSDDLLAIPQITPNLNGCMLGIDLGSKPGRKPFVNSGKIEVVF